MLPLAKAGVSRFAFPGRLRRLKPWLPLCLRQDQKLAACHPLRIPEGRRSRRSPEPPGHASGLPSMSQASLLLLPLPTWAWFPDIPRALAGPAHGCQKRGFLENDHLCGLDLRVIGSGGAGGDWRPAAQGLGEDCPVLPHLPCPLPTASCCLWGPGGISQAPPLRVTLLIALC